MRSDHTAILSTFKITAIKFKVTEKVLAYTDWELIGYHNLTNELFDNIIYISISGGTTYSNYNKHMLEASTNTATINNQRNKVWFYLSRDSLLPLIEERDALLSYYRTLGIRKGDLSEAKIRLRVLQLAVYDDIALAKLAWYSHQAEKIHPMCFNPNEEW